jgi:hypothetical protein
MRRRTVLAAAPALVAGCLGDDGSGSTTASTRTTTTTTTTSTETTSTATTTDQPYDLLPPDPESMTADEVQERFADRNCTALSDLPTTCPGDDARLHVSVSPTVGDLSGGTVEFTVENRAAEPFKWNPYDWRLQKWDGNRWRHIAPLGIPAPLDSLPSGESHTYRIRAVEDRVADSSLAYAAERDVTVGGLGPGVYGFSTDGYFESAPDDELAVAAVFGFAGEGPPIRPTEEGRDVTRDGSELVVHATDPEHDPTEVTVSLVDGDPDVRLIPEHVHQLAALRNTLPYAATDGVETIRYVGNPGDARVTDSYLSAVTPRDASRYGFRNLAFEVSVEET